ncbi:elicitin-like protein [Phytophthora infestans T30-4]|uniref:Elicitin n=1 Tax=Phytophthora infestans (strain T30-4) TaxID=403677 RepID=D0NH21_PHYIT|nr:elicitin-like protein [Phytophthora infestans T30-4]EEY58660.1 elicitin-like protein [Phytophthora infestans T30-4]|eukprot:XP_002901604.1 elicitin-like protein [Phytophthora infestans T30-4]
MFHPRENGVQYCITFEFASLPPLRSHSVQWLRSRFAFTFATSTLLLASVASAADECSSSVSETIVATIDNSTYYDTCAVEDEGVTFNVSTLFDVLNFTDSEFLMFCNSSTCLGPVHEMIHSIPSDCLILGQGTT